MNKVLIFCISLVAISCSSSPEADVAVERTVEEINAERGDPCDCIASKLEFIDAFTQELSDGKFTNSVDLNNAFSDVMKGCLSPLGHQEADAAWALAMNDCESFEEMKNAMKIVRDAAFDLKTSEQNEFIEEIESGSAGDILDRLKQGASS
jgi:hypothetical protein